MAYPSVDAPYGLKPVNLLGGTPFSGATRTYPIQNAYATSIFYGDFVLVTRGFVTRAAVSTGTGVNVATGVFLGCTYTNPTTKQKLFSQYWPASTAAGDAEAVVCDDPDTVFKAVVCSATTAVASAAQAMVGCNVSFVDNTGSTTTGNSANAVLAPSDTPVATALPGRIVGLVKSTAVSYTATGSSSGTAITLTGSGAPKAVLVGTDVSYVDTNGRIVQCASFIDTAAVSGATSLVFNQAMAAPGSITAIPAASTIIFTEYPEVLVKLNIGSQGWASQTLA